MKRESRVLVTLDKGLGDVRFRSADEPAVVLIRFPSAGRKALLDFVIPLLPGLVLRLRTGNYRVLVVTERGVRAR
jgi:predicted nuclease of predicted toxin-antitoxin system